MHLFKFIFLLFSPILATTYKEDIELAITPEIVLETKKLKFPRYPNAYNPSIIPLKEGYLLTMRFHPKVSQLSYSDIVAVKLDSEFNPISAPYKIEVRPKLSKTASQAEDARIFEHDGSIYLIYNDFEESTWIWQNPRFLYIAKLKEEEGKFVLDKKVLLSYPDRSTFIEKNWVPFSSNSKLYLSYKIDPHEVIEVDLETGICKPQFYSIKDIQWPYGSIRGGTPGILVDGQFLAFAHSSFKFSSEIDKNYFGFKYVMFAYTYSALPPYELTAISPIPIVGKDFYSKESKWKKVIFPGGFVEKGPYLYVAYGKDDCEIFIAKLDKKALLESLTSVFQIPSALLPSAHTHEACSLKF
jgi:predicted GH43/DUF377 family glycosyl hydrolase